MTIQVGQALRTGWWSGERVVAQQYGCTSYSREPLAAGHHVCPPLASHWHSGIDVGFGADCGAQLFAAFPVTVVSIGGLDHVGFGDYYPRLRIGGHDIILGHVQPPVVVTPGQQVPTGGLLAHVGSQGFSSGCHLHFEVRPAGGVYWSDIDPTNYLLGQISDQGDDDMSGTAVPWYWAEKNEQHCIQVSVGGNLWHKWLPSGAGWQNRELVEVQPLGVQLAVDNGVPRPISIVRYPGQWQIFGDTKNDRVLHIWKGDTQASGDPWSVALLP